MIIMVYLFLLTMLKLINSLLLLTQSSNIISSLTSYILNRHQVYDPEVENPKEKKKKQPKDIQAVKSKAKRTPDTEQEFVRKYGIGVPTYDLLEPQVGVTYIENGKTKNSVKNRFNLTSVTSGSLISTLGANPRLTKTEYLQLTKGGNLSRANLGEKDPNAATMKSNDENKRIQQESGKEQWTIKVGGVKDVGFNTTGAMRMAQHYRDADGEGVKYDPAKLETLLKASEEIRQEAMQPPKQLKNEKFAVDDTLKRSPIDTFNLELLNSKDWGKSGYSGGMNSLPKLPSHARMQLEQSLGKNKQVPRYRATNVPAQKNYTELLMDTIKSQQMA